MIALPVEMYGVGTSDGTDVCSAACVNDDDDDADDDDNDDAVLNDVSARAGEVSGVLTISEVSGNTLTVDASTKSVGKSVVWPLSVLVYDGELCTGLYVGVIVDAVVGLVSSGGANVGVASSISVNTNM